MKEFIFYLKLVIFYGSYSLYVANKAISSPIAFQNNHFLDKSCTAKRAQSLGFLSPLAKSAPLHHSYLRTSCSESSMFTSRFSFYLPEQSPFLHRYVSSNGRNGKLENRLFYRKNSADESKSSISSGKDSNFLDAFVGKERKEEEVGEMSATEITLMKMIQKLKQSGLSDNEIIDFVSNDSDEGGTEVEFVDEDYQQDFFQANPKAFLMEDNGASILNSVVRVYCTHVEPSFSTPWQRGQQYSSTSSGFVIGNQTIITNAHSVEYGSMIQIRKRGSEKKFVAELVAYGPECDLAVLKVKDASFWTDIDPLELGELPQLLDDVSVIGYPIGGESLSVTSGVVSRVEMQEYAQGEMQLLAIQIDAAINSGNSGGPVVNVKGELVGVAFQTLVEDDAENIGYVVPIDVLNHFLQDIERHGQYTGFCSLGVQFQSMESQACQKYYKVPKGKTGVLIRKVQKLAPATNKLFKDDIILSVDGINIANDGSIPFRNGERTQLHYYFSTLFEGDTVNLEILRNGEIINEKVNVWISKPLTPVHLANKAPVYAMVGGLVFTTLNHPYIRSSLGDTYTPSTFSEVSMLSNTQKSMDFVDQEIVVLSERLEHAVNLGYEGMTNSELVKFNGQNVRNLRHLCQMIDDCITEQYIFEFQHERVIILDREEAQKASLEISDIHSIPNLRSKFLNVQRERSPGEDN